jgi:hypothetical protein
MTAKKITYDLTPEQLEAKRLEIEKRLIALQKEKRKAKRQAGLVVVKTVLTPFVFVFGFFVLIIFGAMFGVVGESMKKIYK